MVTGCPVTPAVSLDDSWFMRRIKTNQKGKCRSNVTICALATAMFQLSVPTADEAHRSAKTPQDTDQVGHQKLTINAKFFFHFWASISPRIAFSIPHFQRSIQSRTTFDSIKVSTQIPSCRLIFLREILTGNEVI
jgi:hypothetical protein